MNRHDLPRAARGSRQSPKSRLPRVVGAKSAIRALPLPFCFFNSQLSTLNFQLLTSCRLTFHPSNVPTFKRSPVPAPIPVSELTPPASQKKSPLSFHALTWNPFCNPFVFIFMHVVGGVESVWVFSFEGRDHDILRTGVWPHTIPGHDL